MNNFEKGMIYMKILKKGEGSREKGGGGNEIHAPCACDVCGTIKVNLLWIIGSIHVTCR